MNTAAERAAYMAAAIDGEGSIGVAKQGTDDAQWRRSATYTFRVQVTNTNKAWLEQLSAWYGGSIHRAGNERKNRKPCWVLVFRSVVAQSLLASVMPYLLMKKRQAELVMEFIPLALERKATSRPSERAPKDIIQKQEVIYQELKSLNARGLVQLNVGGAPRSDRVCVISDCGRKHYGRGYCWKHYRKNIVRGGTAFYEKQCVQCGRDFVARRSDTKCCSKACVDRLLYTANRGARLEYSKAYRERKKVQLVGQRVP